MAEIYSDLDSPSFNAHQASALSKHILAGKGVWGLRSILYPYQRRSVAMMLEKEVSSHAINDPTYITVVGMQEETYFLQPGSLEILKDCPMVSPCQGGILCEELGMYVCGWSIFVIY